MERHNALIVHDLKNKYDYSEYLSQCYEENKTPVEWFIYVQIVLTYQKAIDTYPNLPVDEAYNLFLEVNNNNETVISVPLSIDSATTKHTSSGCGSCGGGRIR